MSITTYMYAYELRQERRAEFMDWARKTGLPFWLSRPGLLSYRTYRVHAGNATSMALAEFASAEDVGRMLDSPEWVTVLGEFQSYISDMRSWVLGPGATGEEPVRPASLDAS